MQIIFNNTIMAAFFQSPVFRCVESDDDLKGNQYSAYKVPQDFVHLACGEDPNKLSDILKVGVKPVETTSELILTNVPVYYRYNLFILL